MGKSHHRAFCAGVWRLRRGYLGNGEGQAMDWDVEIDCVGLLCPLPVLRARKALGGLNKGQVLRVLASDAMAAIDLRHYCTETGHEFLGSSAMAGGMAYLIRCR